MSRYQQAPYSDAPEGNPGYGQSYGHGGGYNNNASYAQGGAGQGGYSDEPFDDGYNNGKYAGGGAGNSYPMSSQNPYASASSPGAGYAQHKRKRNLWLWIGIPLALIVIIGAVLGGVLGTQLNKDGSSSSKSGSSGSGSSNENSIPSGVSNANTATSTGANGQRYLAIATDTYMLPVYATGTDTAGYSTPTVLASPSKMDSWPTDPVTPSNSSIRDHPRLIAPQYKWDALTSGGLIESDPYFAFWNATIVEAAVLNMTKAVQGFVLDGGTTGSGILDPARIIKERIKAFAYAYRVTNNTAFAERAWEELENAMSPAFGQNGVTTWNPPHFLDVAEMTSAFAIGYDWLYSYWSDDQKTQIRNAIITYGLEQGQIEYNTSAGWWRSTNGNWNCVCNAGLTMGALAIMGDDTTGTAEAILALTVPNAFGNCFQAVHPDGTWTETANYWYFGTTGAAEMSSALNTAFGDDRGLATSNPGYALTSTFHIYIQGMTSLFNYGDCGPNKYSTTANSLLYWATAFNDPRGALYQRDHYDAPEPWSMFWYDPATSGTWWDGLPLDHHFNDTSGEWATARSVWSDNSGSYWAIKSGALQGHQTHGDLDLGDFVYDAAGQRWFGELGSGQYLSDGYFSNETQQSERWLYYRKRTEGQNTILVNYDNQIVTAVPPVGNWGSSGTAQGPAPSLSLQSDDTAYFVQDLSSAYNYPIKRGIRFLNARQQMLLQDDVEVPSGTDVMWRAHTNATVTVASNGTSAELALDGQTLTATIVSGPPTATFSTMQPTPLSQDSPTVPTGPNTQEDGNQPNPGVTVLVVDNPNGGTYSLQVLFTPQWAGVDTASFGTPKNVSLDSWSLTSHN